MAQEINVDRFLVPGVNHCRGCHAEIEWHKTALGKPVATNKGKRVKVLIQPKDAPPLIVDGAMLVHEAVCPRLQALADAAKAGAKLPRGTMAGSP